MKQKLIRTIILIIGAIVALLTQYGFFMNLAK
jgi:hypothetical protein